MVSLPPRTKRSLNGSSPRRRDRHRGFRFRDAACDPSGLDTIGGPHSRCRRPSARRSFGTSDRQRRLDRRASPSRGDRVAQPHSSSRSRSSDPLRGRRPRCGRGREAPRARTLTGRLTSRRGRSRFAAEPHPTARQETHRSGLGWNVARSRPPTSDRLPPGNRTWVHREGRDPPLARVLRRHLGDLRHGGLRRRARRRHPHRAGMPPASTRRMAPSDPCRIAGSAGDRHGPCR